MQMDRDHPRLRGEKVALISTLSLMRGSPPLTRGKADALTDEIYSKRITPAYAGKRNRLFYNRFRKKDHPRLRGEKKIHDCRLLP